MSRAGVLVAALVLVGAAGLRAALAARRRQPAAGRAAALQPAAGPGRRLAATAGSQPPGWLVDRLADTGLSVDPTLAWLGGQVVAVLLVLWAAIAAGPAAAVVAAAVAVGGPALAWRLLRHRGSARLEAALPAAVEEVARSLRSGASLRQAVAEAAGATTGVLGADLADVAAVAERGAGLVPALEGWAARRPLPGVQLVVAALCLCAETGGAAARAVDAVAVTLRQRLAAQAEARALATQARVSAAVIAVAPLAFCALSAAVDPRSISFLLRTKVGLVLLAAGLALDALGALWMGRLTRPLDALASAPSAGRRRPPAATFPGTRPRIQGSHVGQRPGEVA